MDRVSLVT